MEKLPTNITERIIELKKEEWLTNRAIKAKIAEELGHSVGLATISKLTSEILSESIKKKMPDVPKFKTREVDGDMYYIFPYFDKEAGVLKEFDPILVTTIKSIVYDYSIHGGDMSQQQILEKYELPWTFWSIIKTRLKLGKHSNIIDPVSLQILEEMWTEAVDSEIDEMTNQAVHDKYKKKYITTYKTSLEKNGIAALKREATREAIVDGVEQRVKLMGLPKLPPIPKINVKKSSWEILTITDLHIGKKGTFEIFDHLDLIGQQAIDSPSTEIYLELLGDLGEIFVEGGRHPWQIESMEGKYGFDLIMQVVETLTRFIYNIAQHKRVHVIGIWGNHDVFSTAKEGDQARTAALVCYTMIKERLREQENITMIIPRDAIYVYAVGKILNIIAHGDEIARKSLPHVIVEYGDTSMYNVVKYGHLHYTHLKETSEKGLMLGCPWLAWKGEFDKRKMLSANVGNVSMRENPYSDKWMPSVTINLQ